MHAFGMAIYIGRPIFVDKLGQFAFEKLFSVYEILGKHCLEGLYSSGGEVSLWVGRGLWLVGHMFHEIKTVKGKSGLWHSLHGSNI